MVTLTTLSRSTATHYSQGKPIRVLVVDDSVVIRRLVSVALSEDPVVEVVGVAANGSIALSKIPQLRPDVLTLDVEMPEMDGLETLTRVKEQFPHLRVVMFSTLTERGGQTTLDALSRGADDYCTKSIGSGKFEAQLEKLREEMLPKIKQFFTVDRGSAPGRPATVKPASTAPREAPLYRGRVEAIAIGISTGGPNALAEILPLFPEDLRPPIFVTQHMPPMFTRLLAARLDGRSQIRVEEGAEGTVVVPGRAYIAPGDYHMTLDRRGTNLVITLSQEPPENSCRPAADVMFRSVSEAYGPRALAVILTGMGKDGLAGIRQMRAIGSPVIAQDKASSTVWGMPGNVVEAGLADQVVPLLDVTAAILRHV
jgi:two-component system chemotaxis response regulator CheB